MIRGMRAAAVAVLVVTVLVVTVIGSVLAVTSPPQSGEPSLLTSSIGWQLFLPPSIVVALAVTWMVRLRGQRDLAGWMLAATAATAFYHFASASVPWLADRATTGVGGVLTLLALSMSGGGWCLVLALLQATAVVAAEASLGTPYGRRWRWVLVAGGVLVYVASVLLVHPETTGRLALLPSVLPPDVVDSVAGQAILAVSVYGWMLSLLVTPVVLWVSAARERGARRGALARVAVGALLPAIVVMLCGVLAAFLWADAAVELEANSLSVGFCLALPATLLWLAATARAATSAVATSATSLSRVLRFGLWAFFVLAVIQTAGPLATLLGGGTAWGALTATALLAATVWPWVLLVRWCVRKIDPRASVAAAVIASGGSSEPSAAVAQRALREALGDPTAAVMLARPGGRWIDAYGEPVPAPAGPDDSPDVAIDRVSIHPLTEPDGRPLGALAHRARFIDLRPVAAALRPLIQRAALEADVREESARVMSERRRADHAVVEARTRIERDLHDGVQGRLVSLGLELGLARANIDDPRAQLVIEETVVGLQTAVHELRMVSQGTAAESLTRAGLSAALGELVRRTPVEIDLRVGEVALDPDARAVAYFVVAEAVTNAVKHAAPDAIVVSIQQDAETHVTVMVSDDGRGGADMRAGTGLRGLSERVHAVGGRLVVSDAVPHGTVLEAVLPCAS